MRGQRRLSAGSGACPPARTLLSVPRVSPRLGRWPGSVRCGRRQTWKRSEEHTSELQSHSDLVCRLLLEKKKQDNLSIPDSPSSGTTTMIITVKQGTRPVFDTLSVSSGHGTHPRDELVISTTDAVASIRV